MRQYVPSRFELKGRTLSPRARARGRACDNSLPLSTVSCNRCADLRIWIVRQGLQAHARRKCVATSGLRNKQVTTRVDCACVAGTARQTIEACATDRTPTTVNARLNVRSYSRLAAHAQAAHASSRASNFSIGSAETQ